MKFSNFSISRIYSEGCDEWIYLNNFLFSFWIFFASINSKLSLPSSWFNSCLRRSVCFLIEKWKCLFLDNISSFFSVFCCVSCILFLFIVVISTHTHYTHFVGLKKNILKINSRVRRTSKGPDSQTYGFYHTQNVKKFPFSSFFIIKKIFCCYFFVVCTWTTTTNKFSLFYFQEIFLDMQKRIASTRRCFVLCSHMQNLNFHKMRKKTWKRSREA